LATYSESFDNAAWGKVNVAVNANVLTSPDGSLNADKLVATATTGTHFLLVPLTSASPAVLSVFAKAGEETIFAIGNATGSAAVVFDLSTGTITSGTGGTIVNYGNGWYRCSYYRTSWTDFQYFALRGNAPSYTGNGTDGIFIYGGQFEVGAYATSYIPTTSAAVTRVAEFTKKTGISSLIGSTEGVLYAEVDYKTTNESGTVLLDVNDNDLTNRVIIFFGAGVIGAFIQGSTIISYSVPSFGTYKIAFGYKSGNFVLYVNGVQRGTSSASVTFSGMNQLFLGQTFDINNSQPVNGIKQALLFKTRLTNAQLAELTTL
jgi:hypothetical protein